MNAVPWSGNIPIPVSCALTAEYVRLENGFLRGKRARYYLFSWLLLATIGTSILAHSPNDKRRGSAWEEYCAGQLSVELQLRRSVARFGCSESLKSAPEIVLLILHSQCEVRANRQINKFKRMDFVMKCWSYFGVIGMEEPLGMWMVWSGGAAGLKFYHDVWLTWAKHNI